MKKCYLIRHALPGFPGGKKMCLGTTDVPLGQEGFRQAQDMASSLPPVTAVFSSDLQRAIETAQQIGTHRILKGLRELYAGEWDGLTFEQIRMKFPDLYAARASDLTIPLPGAESTEQGLIRFAEAMKNAAEQSDGDFAVVAHGGIMAYFLQTVTGNWYKPDYAEVVVLNWEDGHYYQ